MKKTSAYRCYPLFDECDADLAARAWRLNRKGYARSEFWVKDESGRGVYVTRFAHRIVLERVVGRKLSPNELGDHINFNPLDNRRVNLRVVSKKENSQHLQPRNATGYRGVTFHKAAKKWQATVGCSKRSHYCGLYDTPQQAGEAAAAKRRQLGFFGEAAT